VENAKADLSKWVNKTLDVMGEAVPVLTEVEWVRLSIPKGSLSKEDREKIESHVSHTYKFLSQIPWTGALREVPLIAQAHHEKLDGSGYPQGLKAAQIPFESQIMAITDIYDALTAPDRPYKKSIQPERAIEILHMDADKSKLNKNLVQLFQERKVNLVSSRK
jgi:HD-GYP domain-containing protein (c-di-GMP phosphodiesterase class II)